MTADGHVLGTSEARVKILFIAWYFPPSNTIAAVRLGKLAKFLTQFGHDVRVLTADDVPYSSTLPVEIPQERIYGTSWTDINAYPSRIKQALRRGLGRGGAGRRTGSAATNPRERPRGTTYHGSSLSKLYELLFNFPDKRVGWLPAARRRALRLFEDWRPDAIFATAPPFTALLIGYLLARRAGIPLVVEFRDRWSDDPYYPPPWWRRRLEHWTEDRIVRHAVGLTTVSEPWAETYRRRYGKPVAVIYNGYDPADQEAGGAEGTAQGGWPERGVLRIIHTGGIYRGRRDPSPLFDAISRYPDLKRRVRVVFYGLATDYVPAIARDFGVEDVIEVQPRVEHAEALRQQRLSDVLLLMQMDSPLEQGNVPGKFLEYLGARRPILVLGWDQGVPATIVKQRAAGAATTDPEAIARQLRVWLTAKERDGCLPDLSTEVCAGFTHEEQADRLAAFLHAVVDHKPA